jgi:hypothetical protein
MYSVENNLSELIDVDTSTRASQKSELPYEPGQYRPSDRDGRRKYSNKFMRAVLDSLQLSESPIELEPSHFESALSLSDEEKSGLPYDEGTFGPHNPDGQKRYTNTFLKAVGRSTRASLNKNHQKIEDFSFDQLPYELGQYRPTCPDGDKRYTAKFLKAVGEMLMPDEDATEIAPLLSERSIFPWDLHVVRSNRYRAPKQVNNDVWL